MKKIFLFLLLLGIANSGAGHVLSVTPAARGADYSLNTEEYLSYAVLSHAFPSNPKYDWSIDFAERAGAAKDWMARSISGCVAGFTAVPSGWFGVTLKQAYTAVVGSNRGTALGAWAEVARQYADHDYPAYTGQSDMMSRNTLWEKIRFTLDGFAYAPDGGLQTDTTTPGNAFLRGTQYLYNLNTITGVGFLSAVDSADMNASGFTGQIIRKRLADLRSGRSDGNEADCGEDSVSPLNRFWASPFTTVHDADERDGYAPFRYKSVGAALGYDREHGPFTFGGALFYSDGSYTDKWAPVSGENESGHYGLSAYGAWYVLEKLFVEAHAGYQHSRNRIRRELIGTGGVPYSPPAYHRSACAGAVGGDWLDAKTRTGTWWLAARTGYDFGPWYNVIVTPSIGLEYRRSGNSGFVVRDSAGIPFMVVERMRRSGLFLPLDLSVQYRLDVCDMFAMTLRAGGGYTYNFTTRGTYGTMRYAGMSRSVAIHGVKPRDGSLNTHLGAKFDIRDSVEVGAEYRMEGGDAYGWSGSISIKF